MENNSTNEINTIQIPSVNSVYPMPVKISFWLQGLVFIFNVLFIAYSSVKFDGISDLSVGISSVGSIVITSIFFFFTGLIGTFVGLIYRNEMSFVQKRVSIYLSLLTMTLIVPVALSTFLAKPFTPLMYSLFNSKHIANNEVQREETRQVFARQDAIRAKYGDPEQIKVYNQYTEYFKQPRKIIGIVEDGFMVEGNIHIQIIKDYTGYNFVQLSEEKKKVLLDSLTKTYVNKSFIFIIPPFDPSKESPVYVDISTPWPISISSNGQPTGLSRFNQSTATATEQITANIKASIQGITEPFPESFK